VDYWQKRQEAMYKAGEMQVNQYFKRLEKAFNQTKRELQKTIEAFYFRYAEENGLSFAAAQKRLNAEELGELNDFIALAMDNIGKYNQQVNNMSLKARVTRYQALEMQVDAILRQLYAIDYQAESEKTMQEVYEDTYYRTWYSIDQYHGFHQAFAQVEPRVVEKLLEYPFNGAAFSSRLWKQKDHLQTQLTEAVTTMLIQGKHPSTLTKEFAKKMQSKKFDAYRLLHTESSFLMSEATHAGYKEDGVEKYEILATLDSKTCEICGELDGNVYEVGKEITGVNMPPFHPLCRCTDVPHYADTPTKGMVRVARDPGTGKTYEVPADMTYKQWHEQYVEKNPDKRLAERKQRNKKADNEQFQRYRKILGKDAPETLDSFQTMKYTDSEKWNAKKREFATISKIMEKESYSEEYRSKMRSTYYRFKDKGYEFTDHSLNRYLGQKTGRGKKAFTEDELLKVLDSSVNYLEEGGRTVKFYNGIAAIQNEQTEEVVSIVVRNKPKKGWGSK
jgi:SPP1 gp7 family putative phage head morphogenesis protein